MYFNEMMQNKPLYEKEAILQKRNQEYTEERKRAKIVDAQLDESIKRNKKIETKNAPCATITCESSDAHEYVLKSKY